MKICSQLPCFPGRSSLWVSRVFLLELGVGCLDKAKSQGRRLEWGINSQEMWAEGEGRLQHVLCYRARDERGQWIWREGRKVKVFS